MAISFDRALGIHEDALLLRAKRTQVLSHNLANADTPGYLGRDIDFRQVLSELDASDDKVLRMSATDSRHMGLLTSPMQAELKYRNPYMPSEDGNTVDAKAEYMRFAENAIRYQASLQFLNKKFQGLTDTLKGE